MTLRHLRGGVALIGTAAEFTSANPVLLERQLSLETDTGVQKIGDGTTHYADLDALPGGGGGDASPQLAAKSTAETPWGGPGIYSLTGSSPDTAGWVNVDITDVSVDLAFGVADGPSWLDQGISESGTTHEAYGVMKASDGSLDAYAGFRTRVDDSVPYASGWIGASDPGPVEANQGAGIGLNWGAGGTQIVARADTSEVQTQPIMRILASDNTLLFQIEADGSATILLRSPDQSLHRLLVADDGTLSTESA